MNDPLTAALHRLKIIGKKPSLASFRNVRDDSAIKKASRKGGSRRGGDPRGESPAMEIRAGHLALTSSSRRQQVATPLPLTF